MNSALATLGHQAMHSLSSNRLEQLTQTDKPINHTSESSTANQLLTPTPMQSDITIDHNPTSSDFHPSASSNVPDSTHSDSRPMRTRRLPLRYRDELPEPPPPVIQNPPAPLLTHVILHVFDSIHTNMNIFGIACEYCHRPSYDPDQFVSTDELSNIHPHNIGANAAQDSDVPSAYPTSHKPPWPWKKYVYLEINVLDDDRE
ncbi:hypothetical protein CY34DRAFT_18910 [Suillus luteus UH-Slu-Lm8-n1]|uniref:Uncharacterized protein n=1 Tax=Suillus luteus UH-Slu-Lm8-n1 TaxID=930992 RepID=A0A0D0AEG8_9AGAM|nr:hypothetical protein CY34DRAFT_18910 [Suillus luteus UH-Slu-Lm8-n1]